MFKKRKEVEDPDIKGTVIGVVIVLGIYALGAWGIIWMFGPSFKAILIYIFVWIALCGSSIIILELWMDEVVELSFVFDRLWYRIRGLDKYGNKKKN